IRSGQDSVAHQLQTMDAANGLRFAIYHVASAERDYLLTGDGKFLREFRDADARLVKASDYLKYVVQDDKEISALAAIVGWRASNGLIKARRLVRHHHPHTRHVRHYANRTGELFAAAPLSWIVEKVLAKAQQRQDAAERNLNESTRHLHQMVLVFALMAFG